MSLALVQSFWRPFRRTLLTDGDPYAQGALSRLAPAHAELPAFKVRGQWRFRRTDLEAWIDAKTRGGAAEEESK